MLSTLITKLPSVSVYLGAAPEPTHLPAVIVYPGTAAPQRRAISGQGHTRLATTRVVCATADCEACTLLADRVVGLLDGPVYRAGYVSSPLFSDGTWSSTIEFVHRLDRIST